MARVNTKNVAKPKNTKQKNVQKQATPAKQENEQKPVKQDQTQNVEHKKRSNVPEELEHELKFKTALDGLKTEVNNQTKVLKDLKLNIKKLESSYQHDINKAVKVKKRKAGPNKPTGFVKELELVKELADLINVPEGTKISMPTYTKKFYEMLKREHLYYENDGRVLRANDQIKKVFNLPDSVNDSTDYKDKNGFNFYTLQKHIASVNKNLKTKAKDTN